MYEITENFFSVALGKFAEDSPESRAIEAFNRLLDMPISKTVVVYSAFGLFTKYPEKGLSEFKRSYFRRS